MKKQRRIPSVLNPTMIKDKQGQLFILSAPSGAGKTTLARAVLKRFDDICYSVSFTTRTPRNTEQNGVDYHFITKKEFKKNIDNGFWAEWAMVHENYYGTSAEFIDHGLSSGRDVLLDIDVQGTVQILEHYPDSATIFIMPPTLKALKERLEMRGTENRAAIEKRLINAKEEMAQKDRYRHVIVNDHLPEAVEKLTAIIEQYRGPIPKSRR